ncbi:MAG: hypothetical protein ACI8TQ_001568 [Planctomycetota bacterium]|jgi:hypothetical protein
MVGTRFDLRRVATPPSRYYLRSNVVNDAMKHSISLLVCLVLSGCSTTQFTESIVTARQEQISDFRRFTSAKADSSVETNIRLERVSTGVPWPRGMVMVDGELVALARGRHRNAGGIAPGIPDNSGSLFRVDPTITEPVIRGRAAGEAVQANASIFVEPSDSTFLLYRPEAGPPIDQISMDRPYCTLAYDEVSKNYFICGYSGVDLPAKKFRKNATDSIHRYDTRTSNWSSVELHNVDSVPTDELDYVVSNEFYPHHDPAQNPAPHGLLNGPNGAWIVGSYLYAVGKDNHTLAQYDLSDIRRDPNAGAPPSRIVMQDRVELKLDGEWQEVQLFGHSSLVAHEGYLYMGYRTSSVVVRFPLTEDGNLRGSSAEQMDRGELLRGELIAVFNPWDADTRYSANLIDLRFNSQGELFVSCAEMGRVWNIGIPDAEHPFDGVDRAESPTQNRPFLDLRELTDNPYARVGNIAFDAEDRLFVCSGNYDSGTEIAGVIYRAARE